MIKKITICSLFICLPLSSFALFGRHHHHKHKRSAERDSIALAESGLVIPQPTLNPCGRFSSHPTIDSLLTFAFSNLNKPYRSGSVGPNAFDCSGFTRYVYSHFGYNLDHNSGSQSSYGVEVPKDQLKPGDLVFFKGRNAKASRIGHVGIVSAVNEDGSFSFIHSANGTGISNDNSTGPYYTKRYVTARRIINQDGYDNIPRFLAKPTPAPAPMPARNILIDPTRVKDDDNTENSDKSSAEVSSITVEKGQNLSLIAKKYNCTIKQLREWNNLKSNRLRIGQQLKLNDAATDDSNATEMAEKNQKVQNSESGLTAAASDEKARILIHHVRKGENLFVIALKYGCTANDLKKWNNLSSAAVRPNQKLYIGDKKNSNSPVYYIVQRGETLDRIADENQTSVSKLKRLNHLSTTRIQEGNYLQIQ